MEQSTHYWVPSIAPSGRAFCASAKFPEWKDLLFVGALARQHLARLTLNGERVVAEEKLLTELDIHIPDVRQGRDGYLYVLTDDRNDKLFRVAPRQGALSLEWHAPSTGRHLRHKPGLRIVARDEACHHYGVRDHHGFPLEARITPSVGDFF